MYRLASWWNRYIDDLDLLLEDLCHLSYLDLDGLTPDYYNELE